jgi:hypothetical protein
MKAEITNKKKDFEPIEIKITIESFDELSELASRLNINTNELNKIDGNYGEVLDLSSSLWKLLDNLYNKHK